MARNAIVKTGIVAIAASAISFFSTGVAYAGQATSSVSVSATVANNCTITSPTALAFGSYDPVVANASANLDISPNALSVACTKGAAATITLDQGANGAGGLRYMKAGSNTLNYEVYTATARTTVWNTTNTVSYNSAGKAAAALPVYGRIPAGQDIPAGSYADTLTATINF